MGRVQLFDFDFLLVEGESFLQFFVLEGQLIDFIFEIVNLLMQSCLILDMLPPFDLYFVVDLLKFVGIEQQDVLVSILETGYFVFLALQFSLLDLHFLLVFLALLLQFQSLFL